MADLTSEQLKVGTVYTRKELSSLFSITDATLKLVSFDPRERHLSGSLSTGSMRRDELGPCLGAFQPLHVATVRLRHRDHDIVAEGIKRVAFLVLVSAAVIDTRNARLMATDVV
jgi:hypothetical protein